MYLNKLLKAIKLIESAGIDLSECPIEADNSTLQFRVFEKQISEDSGVGKQLLALDCYISDKYGWIVHY